MQYFERAEFEYHPENQAPYDLLLTQLGTFRNGAKQNPAHSAARIELPHQAGHAATMVKASGDNIVWQELRPAPGPPNSHTPPPTYLGTPFYNLTSGQVYTVTADAGSYDLAGPLFAWTDAGGSIEIEDLNSGEHYQLNGPSGYEPAIHGRTVAWMHFSTDETSIFSEEIGSAEVRNVVTYSKAQLNNGLIGAPQISDTYIVWSVSHSQGPSGTDYEIYAYDRRTSTSKVVVSFSTPATDNSVRYALDGTRLVWTETPGLYYTDLSSGQPVELYNHWADSPTINGDLVLWNASGADRSCYEEQCHIWADQLNDGQAFQLTTDPGAQLGPVVDGDLLIWTEPTQDNGNKIVIASLSHLLAIAGK